MSMAFDGLGEAPDEALLVAYGNGDRAAARELTLRLAPRILAYANRMLGDVSEAEDVTQETMFRLWRIAPKWENGRAKVSTWAFRVATNLCTDRLRARRNVGLDTVPDPVDPSPRADQTLQDKARSAALEQALLSLPERQRTAIILRHLDGLQNTEIAEVMDTSVEAVESLTARGKKALAEELGRQRRELGFCDG
ncbi:MAG: RNA polymerase sigma factor [Rhodobacteraceae bacterium]|nr:RNA polymerase sigma factor [Paracoccaceae bacterium]